MKKQILSVIAASSVLTAFAQLPVSTAPQNKKAVLEEFTGIYCGYCPDGHQIANGIYNADPNNVILINIHSGGYANVAPGEPDLKTAEGTAIDGMSGMGITGYPAGDMNRVVFSGGVMSGGRGSWSGWASTIKTQTAYVNVALEGTIDVTTRVLTVKAQVYYTGNSPVATNSLNVFLLEDAVNGPQHNYGNPYYNLANYNPDGSYNHNHVLRKALTPTFGLTIPATTTGSTFSTTLNYTVPLTYGATGKTNPCALGNLKLVAFVTESNVNTINGNHGPLTLTNFPNVLDGAVSSLTSETVVCASGDINPQFKLTNLGSAVATSADITYDVNGGTPMTYNWTGTVNPQTTSQYIDLPTISFTPLSTGSNTLHISLTNVNGTADLNTVNNSGTKSIGLAPIANDLNMTMNFTQDRYGSESTWTVYDEILGDVIETDGPFTDLSATGTQLHSKSFVINANTCYKLEVTDAYGDGINSGYGAGGYVLKSGTTSLFTSNGQYGTGETRLYKGTGSFVGIKAVKMNIGSVNVYPNPASNAATLDINLTQNESLNISVINSIGQEVYSVKSKNMEAGSNTVSLNTENWAGGVYFISISSPKGSVSQKLTVTK